MNDSAEAFLLRIEAVNLSQVFEDTGQISVIRGAGMALREVVRDVKDRLEKRIPSAETIQTGASIGLFRFRVDRETAIDCRDDIVRWLDRDRLYRHFTFVVDLQTLADFDQDRERVLALNRFRQFKQPTVRIGDASETEGPCQVDGLRPATTSAPIGGKSIPASASIRKRFYHGVLKKRFFVRDETGLSPSAFRFTHDLEEIAEDKRYGNLNGKLAYLYLDGNSFGKIVGNVADGCQEMEDKIRIHKEWDHYLQECRRDFLREFIADARARPGFTTARNRIRLEILLWGGDEILLVVPAWLGFHTLHAFYHAASAWPLFHEQKLTHAGGLVFCQHKTPVHRIRRLAKDLAERVKDKDRDHDRFECLALESVDYPTESLDRFFSRRYLRLAGSRQPLAPIPDWDSIVRRLPETVLALPKGQVYRLVRTALFEPETFQDRLKRLEQVVDSKLFEKAGSDLEALFGGGGDEPWPWLHLAELWDYLAPRPAS